MLLSSSTHGAEAAEQTDTTAKLLDSAKTIYDSTKTILDSANYETGSSGIDKELQYYIVIMKNTFHEAVAELVQNRLLLDPNGKVDNTTTPDGLNQIVSHPTGYTIKRGTTLTLVWAAIWAQFTATH